MSGGAARLHIILAREAATGIVIRRGPSQHVCTLAWNRDDDTFALGQWFQGRIYERRCDLSTDGTYFLYHAAKYGGKPPDTYTVVSRAPWLTAITWWPIIGGGGGLFTGSATYLGNGHFPPKLLTEEVECVGELGLGSGDEIYHQRLRRDGWLDLGQQQVPSGRVAEGVVVARVFEQPLPHGWLLRKLAYASILHPEGAGCYWDEHQLEHDDGRVLDRRDWEWADWDRDRLVWAEGGRLMAAELSVDGPAEPRCLHDFNPLVFEERRAPYDRRPTQR